MACLCDDSTDVADAVDAVDVVDVYRMYVVDDDGLCYFGDNTCVQAGDNYSCVYTDCRQWSSEDHCHSCSVHIQAVSRTCHMPVAADFVVVVVVVAAAAADDDVVGYGDGLDAGIRRFDCL